LVVGILVLIVIIIVVLVFAGTQVSAFINDTLGAFGVGVREGEIRIPTPIQGQIICDLFVTARWEEQTTITFTVLQPILFFEEKDVEGVGITVDHQDCKVASGTNLSFLPLFDFLGTNDQVVPLDFVFPHPTFFEQTYELSWILIQTDTGKERKVSHYQNIAYEIPAGTFDWRYEQKLVFRDVVPDDYILKIISIDSRFFNLDEGEPFLFTIRDPT